MESAAGRSLYRYFLPADAFVRILVREGSAFELRARPGLDRSAYRRLVIEACCPDFRDDLEGRLAEACPRDPLAAEDLLYQLCVETNPQLDIHTVRLPGEGEPRPEERSGEAAQGDPESWRTRLARRARGLGPRLARRIVGQEEALEVVERTVRKAAAGIARPDRPLGTFLFLGRTGTGKTELARTLATALFARPGEPAAGPLVRIDCSEYALAHEYSKLIGAPPGYIGHDQGGALTDAVRKRPECVVLFDEIEKAHPRMHSLLLQVLDEGRLSDGRGRTTDFTRALVVLTSNAGAAEVQDAARPVGFRGAVPLGAQSLREITTRALESAFSPEFLGRLDATVVFRELTLDDATRIAEGLLSDLAVRVRRRGLRVAFGRAVARWVAERGYSPAAGARELRRVVERELEAPLAELLLAPRPRRGVLVRVGVRRGALALRAAA